MYVLICLGLQQSSTNWMAYEQQKVLIVLRLGSPRQRCQQDYRLVKTCFLVHRCPHSHMEEQATELAGPLVY